MLRQGGFLISKIHQLSGRIFSRKLKAYNINEINPAQGRVLFALWQNDNVSIQELAGKTSLGKSTLTRMLDRLEQSGHLLRVFPSEDRRKTLIQLTEENKKMKAAYEQVSLDMNELFYEGFQQSEIDEFENYLVRILNTLDKYESQMRRK
ncbi:MarR family winged helix-turn-helix transcriptional regulator [Paenibacillus sp. GCM10027626]|uniref:MarR family winged helix-turn-helix transcriptional regulator n=1 Tax=Paenibacillus sp. GCM10027626 TaxID=3273411 RepID=UPI00363EBC49